MMRKRVVRIGNTDLRIRAIAGFARKLERDDSCDIPLQRENPDDRCRSHYRTLRNSSHPDIEGSSDHQPGQKRRDRGRVFQAAVPATPRWASAPRHGRRYRWVGWLRLRRGGLLAGRGLRPARRLRAARRWLGLRPARGLALAGGRFPGPAGRWFPRPGRGVEIEQQLERLRRMAETAGRDPRTISTSVFRAPPDKAALREYEVAGIDRAVLEIPDQSRDEILRLLDGYVPLLDS